MVSPTTCTRCFGSASSEERSVSNVMPFASISAISFSIRSVGGAASINWLDENTISPGVKMISPP